MLEILLSLLLTCQIQVIEDWTINEDGTGSLKLTVNASEDRTRIRASNIGDTTHARIRNHIAQIRNQFSTAQIEENWTDYIFKFSLSFTDINNTNINNKPTLNKNTIDRQLSIRSSTDTKWFIIVRSDKEILADSTWKVSSSRKAVMKTVLPNSEGRADLSIRLVLKN